MTIAPDGESTIALKGDRVFDIREFGMKPPSMLMVRVYPEIAVRVELHGVHATIDVLHHRDRTFR